MVGAPGEIRTPDPLVRSRDDDLRRFESFLFFNQLAGPPSLKTGTVAHEKASNATFSLRCRDCATDATRPHLLAASPQARGGNKHKSRSARNDPNACDFRFSRRHLNCLNGSKSGRCNWHPEIDLAAR